MSEKLVHVVDGAAELVGTEAVPLVVALDGFLDAGNATQLVVRHLEQASDGPVVASFDVDQFHDYRARRPAMSFERDHYADYDAPRLTVRLLTDAAGSPYLLLRGPEPDLRWEGFVQGVREVMDALNVNRVITLGAVPMAVPHSRPLTVTPHATRPELMVGESLWEGTLRIPASATALLQLRLAEWSRDGLGFVVHVPHYVAGGDFPPAALALIEQLELGAQVMIDLSELRSLAEAASQEVVTFLAENDELADVVAGLEQQYDAFQAAAAANRNLLASDQELPTGEELGSQFEAFLAGLDRPTED